MRIRELTIVIAACALGAPLAVHAQQPSVAAAGFNVETLVAELAQLLPGDVSLGGGAGRVGAGGAAQGGGQRAAGQGQRAAGQGGQGAAGAGGGTAGFRVEKDPKLGLTRDQIGKLIPVFEGLKGAPMPSPAAARKVQATLDSILTAAQKEGIEQFRKSREEMLKQFQARIQQAGGGQGGAAGAAAGGPSGSGGGLGGAQGGSNGQTRAPQLTPLERRTRVVEAFLTALQEAQKAAGN